jgi:hypothetical protein
MGGVLFILDEAQAQAGDRLRARGQGRQRRQGLSVVRETAGRFGLKGRYRRRQWHQSSPLQLAQSRTGRGERGLALRIAPIDRATELGDHLGA